MEETATHLADHVFPPLPVRQWVLSVPKRLRYFLQRDSGAAAPTQRLRAVSFVQRFGTSLNAHVHFHCCVIDGVFAVGEDGQVHFAEASVLTPEDLAAVQQQVRARVLRWFARTVHLDPVDAREMVDHNGGISLMHRGSYSCTYETSHITELTRLMAAAGHRIGFGQWLKVAGTRLSEHHSGNRAGLTPNVTITSSEPRVSRTAAA